MSPDLEQTAADMAQQLQLSAVDAMIQAQAGLHVSSHPAHFHDLAAQVLHNLQFQHDWHSLTIHTCATASAASNASMKASEPQIEKLLPRPLISGVPPRRVYIHPDEQIELIKKGIKDEDATPQREWVLPTRLLEKWSLRRFAEIFDAIGNVPPASDDPEDWEGIASNQAKPETKWREIKRVLLAMVEDDSTVVYYVVHDGIVKPRQN